MLNEDAMATEKLADGIRRFNADLREAQGVSSPRSMRQPVQRVNRLVDQASA